MRPFESPDDALPAPLPEGGATEISGSCAPTDQSLDGLDSETKKIELHERLAELRDRQD
jgi:hypothetical protein